jgi:copper oxidase (laccase) domain-containing protein
VGPAICGRCYEVGADVAAAAVEAVPTAASRTPHGTPALDLPRAVLEQLAAAGVTRVSHDARCTAEDPGLYSYRRDGRTGRQAGLVARIPDAP